VTPIDDATVDELVAAARHVRARAYVPYSGFHVGAALLAGDRVITAVNVENASYPLSVCAERNAVAKGISEGETSFRAISVVTDAASTPTPPCGGCRQVLREFGEGITVIAENADGSQRRIWTVGELLPDSFGPDDLAER
jgi:cytidine deaminase